MTDTDRCPVHPSVERVEAPDHDVGRVCPRCEADRQREARVAADGGHELASSVNTDEDDEDATTPRIDDATATVTHDEYVDAAATVAVSGGVAYDGEEEFQVVELQVRAGTVTLDVELTRPAAAALRAELEDALHEAEELAATSQ
ncbi:MAG: hypothetical protein ABEI11_00065 [Haloarculaceae archaeon]